MKVCRKPKARPKDKAPQTPCVFASLAKLENTIGAPELVSINVIIQPHDSSASTDSNTNFPSILQIHVSSIEKRFCKCTYECTCEDAYELTICPPEISKHIIQHFLAL
jgi:hypothetical protein